MYFVSLLVNTELLKYSILLINHLNKILCLVQNGNTALMEASEGGHNAVVKILVDNGADVEDKNKVCVCS